MLIGIDPRLSPEALHAMAAMGHGDILTIVDANFPAHHAGLKTPWGRAVEFAGDSIEALEAILSLMPVDTFDPDQPPVRAMLQVGTPDVLAEPVAQAIPILRAKGFDVALTERFAFYAAAAESFVIVRTRERRFYGNILLRKGVIAP